MSTTARSLITSAFRKIGAVASGETPSSEDLQNGLVLLQGLLDQWSTNNLLPVSETKETFQLTPGKQEYTFGLGGDFDSSRPMAILGINLLATNGIEIPIRQLKFAEWKAIALKTTQSNYPLEFYLQTSWPLAKLSFFPLPNEDRSLIIWSRKPFQALTSVNDTIDLPNGYEPAIIYNLAIEAAPEFGVEPSAAVVKMADDKRRAIETQNLSQHIPLLVAEPAVMGGGSGDRWLLGDLLKGGD